MSNSSETDEQSGQSILATAGGVVPVSIGPGAVSAAKGNDGNEKGHGSDKEKGRDREKDKDGGKQGKGPPECVKNTCPGRTVLLAKHEVKDGKFVFEKDGEYLKVGDVFDLTIMDTKDGGEVLGFEVSNAEQVGDCNEGVYNVHTLSVKTGDTRSADRQWETPSHTGLTPVCRTHSDAGRSIRTLDSARSVASQGPGAEAVA